MTIRVLTTYLPRYTCDGWGYKICCPTRTRAQAVHGLHWQLGLCSVFWVSPELVFHPLTGPGGFWRFWHFLLPPLCLANCSSVKCFLFWSWLWSWSWPWSRWTLLIEIVIFSFELTDGLNYKLHFQTTNRCTIKRRKYASRHHENITILQHKAVRSWNREVTVFLLFCFSDCTNFIGITLVL